MSAVAATTSRPRRWRRRFLWLLLFAVLARVGLGLAAGPALRQVAAQYGLALEYERLDLALLEGRVELWRLSAEVQDEAGGTRPLLEVQTLALDIDTSALWGGHLRVRRMELDGTHVDLHRDAAGNWNLDPLLARLLTGEEDSNSEAPRQDEEQEGDSGPIVLDSPIEIVAGRVRDLRIRLRDELVTPALDTTLTINLTASDIGTAGESAHLDVLATSPELLDLFRLRGSGSTQGANADLRFDVELAKLKLQPVAHLLRPLGLEPLAERIDGGLVVELQVTPADETEESIVATLELRDAELSDDELEALALDSSVIEVREASPEGVHLKQILVEGLRSRAERLPDGALALAGIAWRGVGSTQLDSSAKPEAQATSDSAPNSTEAFQWSLEEVRVQGGRVLLDDRALLPPVELVAELEQLTIGPFSSATDAPAARLEGRATLPGVVQEVRLSGDLELFGEAPGVQLALTAEGIEPERIAPYLALAGIESDFESGRFDIESISVGASDQGGQALLIQGLALRDGASELGAIDRIVLNIQEDRAPGVEVRGARLALTREESGAVNCLGLRFGASPEQPALARAAAQADADGATDGATAPAFSLPILDLPTLSLEFEELLLVDEATDSQPLSLGPFTAELGAGELRAGDERAYELQLEGRTQITEVLEAELRLAQAASGSLSLSGQSHAGGIHLERLRPWLAQLNVEPALEDGNLEGEFALKVETIDGTPLIDLDVGPLALTQGKGSNRREWLGLKSLAVRHLVLGDEIAIESVSLDSPRVVIQRDAEGALLVPGLRLSNPSSEESNSKDTPALNPDAEKAVAESTPGPAAGFLRVASFDLGDAQVLFEDLARAPRHPLELGCDLSLRDLAPGIGAEASQVESRVTLGSWEIETKGELAVDPTDFRATLALAAEGLSGDPWLPYLPPELSVELRDGQLTGQVEARATLASEGGYCLALLASSLDLRERDAERALAGLSEMRTTVSRVDPLAGVFDIDEVVVRGATIDVLRTAAGGVSALGVRLTPPQTSSIDTEGASDQVESKSTPGAPSASPVQQLRIGRLDLELAELFITNEAYGDAPPSITSARFTLREPYEFVFDPELEDVVPPALGFDLVAKVVPGIDQLALALDLAPFAERPRIDGKLAASGISGDGILALAPELSKEIDPAGLTEGTLAGDLGLELNWRRRHPFDFDLSRGFGAEFFLNDLALRPAPDAEIALGVDEVEAVVRRIVPRTGLVDVARIEIDTPRARLRRSAEGLEFAGLLIRLPDPEEENPSPSTTSPEVMAEVETSDSDRVIDEPVVVQEAGANVDNTPQATRTDELRIDSLLVNDIDVILEDLRADPPVLLPLETLGVEVRGFTTRAFDEAIPIRISTSIGAGSVPLPERVESVSIVSGLASGTLGLIAGSEEEIRYEQRPFFEEIALTARLTLAPQPKGWARVSVSAFELPGLRGLAREGGVELGDGLLDFNARVRLDGEEGGRVDALTNLAYLSLSEPAGGPISRYLKLPAPLDTVLFALKNDQGEHRLPLSFDIEPGGGLSTAHLSTKASAALLGLITEALASAPLRAVGGVTDVVGIGGLFGDDEKGAKLAGLTVTLPFSPGSAIIESAERSALAEICEAMDEDPLLELRATHVFGPGDLERAERLASPDSKEAATLLRGLRSRRDELLRRHSERAASARSQLLLGQDALFEATRAELLEINRELGLTENGIDLVAELLRPSSERRRPRRTREAALAIARTRMDSLSRVLLANGVPYQRVDLRSPRFELPETEGGTQVPGKIVLVTRGGTPPKGFFRTLLGWIGL